MLLMFSGGCQAFSPNTLVRLSTLTDRILFFLVRHNIPIGLHANLSEGNPVCQSLQQASTLINQRGFFHGKMGFRQALERGQISMKQVHCSTAPVILLACINEPIDLHPIQTDLGKKNCLCSCSFMNKCN